MTDGIKDHTFDILEPSYDLLGTEPLIQVPENKNAENLICEFVVMRESAPAVIRAKGSNVVFPTIAGTFYVLKYVTNTQTLNRIQIEVPKYEQSMIVLALDKKYNGGRGRAIMG